MQISCPACSRAIEVPDDFDHVRDWLTPRGWCFRCGGTASPVASRPERQS